MKGKALNRLAFRYKGSCKTHYEKSTLKPGNPLMLQPSQSFAMLLSESRSRSREPEQRGLFC